MRPLRSSSLPRIAIILAMLVAWFALTNHCLLGATFAATSDSSVPNCPMHAQASGDAPAKPKESDQTSPCCKILRAIVVAKISSAGNTIDFVLKAYLTGTPLPLVAQPTRSLLALDTGPPPAVSFSESVLQRSILAHAPPTRV